MKYVAFENGAYRCYTSDNGIHRRMLGCAHATPRQAHKHTSRTWADPRRSGSTESPSYPHEPAGSSVRVGGLSGVSDQVLPPAPSSAHPDPAAGIPPAGGGVSLGL